MPQFTLKFKESLRTNHGFIHEHKNIANQRGTNKFKLIQVHTVHKF